MARGKNAAVGFFRQFLHGAQLSIYLFCIMAISIGYSSDIKPLFY
jgi:hypothetical protein